MYPVNNFYYIHDVARSHISKTVQLLERGSRTSLRYQGPMAPDLNSLDFFFWTQVKRKVYEGKLTPFKNLDEVKRKIKSVWPHVAKLLWPANYSTSHTAVQRKIEIFRWSSWPTNQANFLIYLLSILIEIVNWLLNSHRATWNLIRLCFSHSTLKNILS